MGCTLSKSSTTVETIARGRSRSPRRASPQRSNSNSNSPVNVESGRVSNPLSPVVPISGSHSSSKTPDVSQNPSPVSDPPGPTPQVGVATEAEEEEEGQQQQDELELESISSADGDSFEVKESPRGTVDGVNLSPPAASVWASPRAAGPAPGAGHRTTATLVPTLPVGQVPAPVAGGGRVTPWSGADDGTVSELTQSMIEAKKKRETRDRVEVSDLDGIRLLSSNDSISPYASTSGRATPLLPPAALPIRRQVKLPKLANTEPYLRFVDVTMMSSQAVNSKGKRIKVLVVSQDEKELAWCTCEDTQLFMAHISSNTQVGKFTGHSGRLMSASLGAPLGNTYRVATASLDRFCIVWDRDRGNFSSGVKAVLPHRHTVICVNFSHNNKYLVTACQDKMARVYNAKSAECEVVYRGHTDSVFHCAFSPDDQFVSSCSFDLTVHVWSRWNGTNRFTFKGHSKFPMVSSFTSDGKKLISNDQLELRVWDTRGNKGCTRVFRAADCVPPAPRGAKRQDGWTFCSVLPGQILGKNHFIVGCTNGVVYIYNMNHGLPAKNSSSSGTPSSSDGIPSLLSSRESSFICTTSSEAGSQRLVVKAGSTLFTMSSDGVAMSNESDEGPGQSTFYATKDAEVWSYQCKSAVFAIHCGPSGTIALGDSTGNVYVVKVVAG